MEYMSLDHEVDERGWWCTRDVSYSQMKRLFPFNWRTNPTTKYMGRRFYIHEAAVYDVNDRRITVLNTTIGRINSASRRFAASVQEFIGTHPTDYHTTPVTIDEDVSVLCWDEPR